MQRIEAQTAWSHPTDVLDLGPHQVDVWRIPLDLPAATIKSLESTLSADETRRAARFHFPADRQCYIAAHGCLRDLLARYLRCEPGELIFSADSYGKPSLQGHGLQFNLSHSGGFALAAVSQDRRVGVDVERIRTEMDFERIARRFFSQSEVAELMAVPLEQRQSAFFNCWTRKEAYLKAHGLGLSLALDGFDVSLAPGEPALLRATRPNPREADRWTLLSLVVHPAYRAAIAVEIAALGSPALERGSKNASANSHPGPTVSLPQGNSLEFQFWDWKEDQTCAPPLK